MCRNISSSFCATSSYYLLYQRKFAPFPPFKLTAVLHLRLCLFKIPIFQVFDFFEPRKKERFSLYQKSKYYLTSFCF